MGRTGILGGTFDPIHLAHLAMGRAAREEAQLDRVLFMPSRFPPHKRGQQLLPEKMRREMIELALEGEAGFFFSDFEFRRQETTYTARTLSLLKEQQPQEQFFFILGGDSLFSFDRWYRPEVILQKAKILAIARDGMSRRQMSDRAESLMNRFGGDIQVIAMPCMAVSSSDIRDRLFRGEPVEEYLPASVYRYIMERGCYQRKDEPAEGNMNEGLT